MSTTANRSAFRRNVGDIGGQNPLFDDAAIDDLFAEAAEVYPDNSAQVHMAYAVMMGYEALAAQYAVQVNMKANASSEDLSDISKAYERGIKRWKDRLDSLLADESEASTPIVRMGSTRKTPTRDMEYPDA